MNTKYCAFFGDGMTCSLCALTGAVGGWGWTTYFSLGDGRQHVSFYAQCVLRPALCPVCSFAPFGREKSWDPERQLFLESTDILSQLQSRFGILLYIPAHRGSLLDTACSFVHFQSLFFHVGPMIRIYGCRSA